MKGSVIGRFSLPSDGQSVEDIFFADLITRGVSGESIGQHLDDAIGHPLYDWEW